MNRDAMIDSEFDLKSVLKQLRESASQVDAAAEFPHENLQVLRSSGLLGLLVPELYNGPGGSITDLAAVAEQLGAACLSTALIWGMHCQQVDLVVHYGSEALKLDLLPRVAAGEVYIASVTTEAKTGASLMSADAALEHQGDRLSFRRASPVVTGGAQADGFLMTLRADADASAKDVRLVYADRTEVTVAPQGGWNSLGMRGTASAGLSLEGSVDPSRILAPDREFREIAMENVIPTGHIAWASIWLGAARGVFRELISWMRRPRKGGGPDVNSDHLRWQLAHVRADLAVVDALLRDVVTEYETARREGVERMSSVANRIRLNTLKLVASERTFAAVDQMIEIGGMGIGYNEDSAVPLARAFRDLRSASLTHSNSRLWCDTGSLVLLDRQVDL
jgi:alkylation response protein AidB-like acyl-CoA dehydrogenase